MNGTGSSAVPRMRVAGSRESLLKAVMMRDLGPVHRYQKLPSRPMPVLRTTQSPRPCYRVRATATESATAPPTARRDGGRPPARSLERLQVLDHRAPLGVGQVVAEPVSAVALAPEGGVVDELA